MSNGINYRPMCCDAHEHMRKKGGLENISNLPTLRIDEDFLEGLQGPSEDSFCVAGLCIHGQEEVVILR